MLSLFDGLEHKSDLLYRKEQLSDARQKQVLISSLLGASLILMGTLTLNLRSKRKFTAQRAKLIKRKKELVDQKLKNKENDLARMSAYIISKNDLLNSIVSDLEYHTSLIENRKDRRLMNPLKKKIANKIDEDPKVCHEFMFTYIHIVSQSHFNVILYPFLIDIRLQKL